MNGGATRETGAGARLPRADVPPGAFPAPGAGPVVVVGAGTAGCVVARRLADHGHRVVLLEAGPATAPMADRRLTSLDHLDARSVPDRWWPDVRVRRSGGAQGTDYLLGRGLGGSSAVNGAMAEVDLTDPALGPPSEVRAASERLLINVESAGRHEVGPLGAVLLSGANSRLVSLARREGRRDDVATAYLTDVPDRIDLRGDTEVERIERTGHGATVVTTRSEHIDAVAVVMCAGAIHTPAILLRSGLGSRVGGHLQDHPSVVLDVRLERPAPPTALVTSVVAERDGVQLLPLERLGAPGDRHAAVLVALMEPDGAEGSVTIGNDPPGAGLHVDFGVDRSPRDVDRVVDGVRWAAEVLSRAEASKVVTEVRLPGAPSSWSHRRVSELDDVELRSWIVSASGAYYHAAASCGIGRCLDTDGHLLDAGPIFVADAAAFPRIPRTGTHLPTVLQAERLARRWTRERMSS